MGGMPPPPPMGPPPPMAPPPMGAGLGSSAGVVQSSSAPRRRIFWRLFGEYVIWWSASLCSASSSDGYASTAAYGCARDSCDADSPMPSAMPRPMMYGGEVDIFGYADGGSVVQYYEGAGEVKRIDQIYDDLTPAQQSVVTNEQLRKMADRTGRFGRDYFFTNPTKGFLNKEGLSTDHLGYTEDSNRFYDTSNIDDIYANLTMAQKINVTNPQLLMLATGEGRFDGSNFVSTAEESADPVVVDPVVEDDVVVSQPITQITGADSGAGTAVNAGGNFGTGTYTADPVDSSEVNPIDYSQFTGDVGNFSNTGENFALYGPKLNIPTSVSQYMTDPVTGGLTTSYGPEMVATSPIGAIKLPARPVSIDIFDWLSTPTYGTMYSGINSGVSGMRMGGEASSPFSDSSVPRQTEIAGQPHMLAYINPEEENLLRGLGGSGNPGPGGIPAYNPNEDHSRSTGRTTASMRSISAPSIETMNIMGGDEEDYFDVYDKLKKIDPSYDPTDPYGGDGDGDDSVINLVDSVINPVANDFIINPDPYTPPNSDDGNRYIGPNSTDEAIKKAVVDPMSLEGVAPTESPVLSAPKSIDAVGVAPVVSAGGAGPELLTDVPDIFGQNPISLLSPIAPSLISLNERLTPGGGIVPSGSIPFGDSYVPPKVSRAVSSPDFYST